MKPKKSFGQHFLTDARRAQSIAELATTPPGGTVLEVGAGRGALTRHLLARAARVVSIERDRDLLPVLRETFAAPLADGTLVLREADALKLDWAAELEGPRPRVLAGNVPYSITGALLEKAVGASASLDAVVFMIQREVADRLVARADTEAYGALSVFTQARFSIERVAVVRPGAFFPPPAVDSAVIRMLPLVTPRALETDAFREAVKRAFATRRKTLRNAWKGIYGWSRDELEDRARLAGISLDARGETLPVEAFARLAEGAKARAPLAGSSGPAA